MHRLIFCIILALLSSTAQAQHEALMTWEEFVEWGLAGGLQNGEWGMYGDDQEVTDDEVSSSTLPEEDTYLLDRLEDLHNSPLDINAIQREALLTLPFVTEAQADSLLSYRKRHGRIKSLGELQLIRGWDYETRRMISLFVECREHIRGMGPVASEKISDKWRYGVWEAYTRTDIPFYTRAGYSTKPAPTTTSPSNKYYTGSPIVNIVRLRYNYHDRLRYGLTLHKDAGEPFLPGNMRLYDSQSGFFSYKSRDNTWQIVAGDYRLHIGQGLIAGNTYMQSRHALVSGSNANAALWRNRTILSPHTSKLTPNTLRGVAGSMDLWHDDINIRHLSLMAFGSYRTLDARIEDDSVRTIHTSGYHRTPKEQSERDNLGALTTGARLQYETRGNWMIGLGGIYTHYTFPISPKPRIYNKYYLRGSDVAGLSCDYYFRLLPFGTRLLGSTTLRGQGEIAVDQYGHLATAHTLQLTSSRLTATLHGRYIDGAYVTALGQTLIAGSTLQNERAILAGLEFRVLREGTLQTYFEYAFHPNPTYRATQPSGSYEIGVQWVQHFRSNWQMRVSHRTKIQSQNIPQALLPQTKPIVQEYRELHRLSLSLNRLKTYGTGRALQIHAELGGTLYRKQTLAQSAWGWMALIRTNFKASERLTLSASTGYFDTDDYNTRIYVTLPMLSGTGGFNSFAYQGFSAVVMGEWNLASWMRIGARLDLTHYFDRDFIASGLQKIAGRDKTDLTLTMRFKLDRRDKRPRDRQ